MEKSLKTVSQEKSITKQLKVILIGAGNRGETYTRIMSRYPEWFQVIAVAEPIESRRNQIRDLHNIPEELCFEDGKSLLALGKIADIAVIATMDREHFDPVMEAISLKYDILLEKPVSQDPHQCLQIAEYAAAMDARIVVCHVLRYTPFFLSIKKMILDGRLGDIVSINHEECVGNIHQSHSFVRGNWGNMERSSFMLLQKSCHDMDILQWLIGKKCKKVNSFGSLSYFRKENAPKGAPEYCIEGCRHANDCPYDAVKLYLDDKENMWFRTTSTRMANPDDEAVKNALRRTQYGKCVYKCDNNVVDHQTVNMLFEDGITVTFSMNAFNKGGRFIHIFGTKGELYASMDGGQAPIRLYDFSTKETTEIPIVAQDGIQSGHGGGDEGIIHSVYRYFNGTDDISISDIRTSVDNHLLAFAAEESRLSGKVIDIDDYVNSLCYNQPN